MEEEEGDLPWGAVPRKKRSQRQTKKIVYGDQDNVVEEESTETKKITPESLLEQMEMKDYEGYDAYQIMEVKELKATDLDTNQGRFLLPKHVDRCFLKDGELRTLAEIPKKGVSSLFIGTGGKKYAVDVELRDWKNGLVLTKGWGNVIRKETFEIGKKYSLWCFRSRKKNDKLCFALPNVDNKDDKLSGPNDAEEVANENDTHESSSFRYLDDEDLDLPTVADQLKGSVDDLDLPTVADQFNDDDLSLPTVAGFDDVPDITAFFDEDSA